MNIRFEYLYRDGGNYKQFGDVVFANPEGIEIQRLENLVQEALIGEMNFIAEDLHLPLLYFSEKNSDDHGWHEFDSIHETDEEVSDLRTVSKFIAQLNESCKLIRDLTRN